MDNGATVMLKIAAVNLKLKFRCKMRVDYKDKPLTGLIEPKNNQFLFEEEVSLSVSESSCDLNITLQTEKGAQYSGGILKLELEELRREQGNVLNMPLSKCIDK